jgi:hypothetical protein
MKVDDEGATIYLGCQLEASETLSAEHKKAVDNKKKEIEDALKDVSRFEDKKLNKNLSIPISIDNSDSDVEEVLDNKQQQQKRDSDKKKIKNKNGAEEYREDSASSLKRKRNPEEEIDATDGWDAVTADTSSRKDLSSKSVPGLPPPPPPSLEQFKFTGKLR